jgi:nucleoid-associated protein YgaU
VPAEAAPQVAAGEPAAPSAPAAPQVAASEPAAPPAPAAPKDPGVYTARAGDTFKSIAKRLYGSAAKWREIANVNPEVKSKKLRAGQLIKLPSAPTR